jgi:hypothetical protein
MSDVLNRVEALVRGTQPGLAKTAMVYCVWHGVVHPDLQQQNAQGFVEAHAQTLAEPSMVAFVTGVLCNRIPEWTDDQWRELGQARRVYRAKSSHLRLSPRFDTALHAVTSEKLHRQRDNDALRFAGYAIEEMPGERVLLDWEAALRKDSAGDLDIGRALTGAVDEHASEDAVGEREDDGVPADDDGRSLDDGRKSSPAGDPRRS